MLVAGLTSRGHGRPLIAVPMARRWLTTSYDIAMFPGEADGRTLTSSSGWRRVP
jgi:hypothetical protein